MVLLPTLFERALEKLGPKHSTSAPRSAGVAVPLSADVKEVAFVFGPKTLTVITVKLQGPQH